LGAERDPRAGAHQVAEVEALVEGDDRAVALERAEAVPADPLGVAAAGGGEGDAEPVDVEVVAEVGAGVRDANGAEVVGGAGLVRLVAGLGDERVDGVVGHPVAVGVRLGIGLEARAARGAEETVVPGHPSPRASGSGRRSKRGALGGLKSWGCRRSLMAGPRRAAGGPERENSYSVRPSRDPYRLPITA